MNKTDQRYLAWLASLGMEVERIAPLQGDVSPRLYFRVYLRNRAPTILAAYPRSEEDAYRRFLITTRLFEAARIRVPQVHETNPQLRLMLLEDLGSISVFDRIDEPWTDLRRHIEGTLENLVSLGASPSAHFAEVNPRLDARRLELELRDARTVFLDREEFSGDPSSRHALRTALDELTSALALDPLVPSHRDFMSRNLMLPPDGSGAAVIDHQDACLAPAFYDVASLLNDSFFPTKAQEAECLNLLSVDQKQLACYRRCAVQRTLKATATYIKFAHRGCDRHLPLIGPTLSRTALQLEQLPEGRAVPAAIYALWRDPAAIAKAIDRLLGNARNQAPGAQC